MLHGVATLDLTPRPLPEWQKWFESHNIVNHPLIVAEIDGHAASTKLHDKFGFEYCGTIKEVGYKFGAYQDIVNYRLSV